MQNRQAFRLFEEDRIADRGFLAQFPKTNRAKFAVADFVPEMPAEIGVKFPRESVESACRASDMRWRRGWETALSGWPPRISRSRLR